MEYVNCVRRMTMSRRDQNLEATRAALIASARRHFGAAGFAATELNRVAAEAGVTTGAVYHHFGSKQGLFRAVAEAIEAEILAIVATEAQPDLWAGLRAAVVRLVPFCAAPDILRIILVEAPQVIGPEAWREIELRYAYGAARGALEALMAQGVLRRAPVDFVARLLLALLGEAASELARAGDDAALRAQVFVTVDRMLDSLEA